MPEPFWGGDKMSLRRSNKPRNVSALLTIFVYAAIAIFLCAVEGALGRQQCYSCTTLNGDCHNGNCSTTPALGDYCYTQVLPTADGKFSVYKFCNDSSVTPGPWLLQSDGCARLMKAPGVVVTICRCKQSSFCNNQTYLSRFSEFVSATKAEPVAGFSQLTLSGDQLDNVRCYKCNSSNESCNRGECSNKWCSAVILWDREQEYGSLGNKTVQKACASTSVLTAKQQDGCRHIEHDQRNGTDIIECYCRGEYYCNQDKYLHRFLNMPQLVESNNTASNNHLEIEDAEEEQTTVDTTLRAVTASTVFATTACSNSQVVYTSTRNENQIPASSIFSNKLSNYVTNANDCAALCYNHPFCLSAILARAQNRCSFSIAKNADCRTNLGDNPTLSDSFNEHNMQTVISCISCPSQLMSKQ